MEAEDIKKRIFDMADQLIRATAAGGGIRVVGAITTDLTEEARQRHHLSYVATAALGRTMTAGLLLASSMKQRGSRVNIRLKGDGPLGTVMADAGLDGTVRGYVEHPQVELDPTQGGKLDVGAAVGQTGYVYVVRDVGYGYPYSSTVELVSGEVGEDIANYLVSSEQTPSALMLGVFVDPAGVTSAGGMLVQILPKAAQDLALIELLESRLVSLAGFSTLLREGRTLADIFQQILGDVGLTIFPDPLPLRFHCSCSRDRVLSALKLFSISELEEMREEDGGAEATCQFCNNVYRADRDDLQDLIREIRSDAALMN